MCELHRLLEALEDGQLENIVLTQKNRMHGVLISVERYADPQPGLGSAGEPAQRAGPGGVLA